MATNGRRIDTVLWMRFLERTTVRHGDIAAGLSRLQQVIDAAERRADMLDLRRVVKHLAGHLVLLGDD